MQEYILLNCSIGQEFQKLFKNNSKNVVSLKLSDHVLIQSDTFLKKVLNMIRADAIFITNRSLNIPIHKDVSIKGDLFLWELRPIIKRESHRTEIEVEKENDPRFNSETQHSVC